MPDDASRESSPGSTTAPRDPTERRLRRVIGRRDLPYEGPIVAISRGWVSRDGKLHTFAARFLDFAVLTPEYLMFCSTGFFSRQPRRGVFREALNRLVVVPIGPDPTRALRIVGDFSHPLLLELRSDPEHLAFARALLDATQREPRAAAPETPTPTSGDNSTP